MAKKDPDIQAALQQMADNINRTQQQQDTKLPARIPDESVPRIGALSAQAFNELAGRVEETLKEMADSQINNIASQRVKCTAIMADLQNTFEQAFTELERSAKEERERLLHIGEALRQKVMERAQEMIRLSQQLTGFHGAVSQAHDEHLGDRDRNDSVSR